MNGGWGCSKWRMAVPVFLDEIIGIPSLAGEVSTGAGRSVAFVASAVKMKLP